MRGGGGARRRGRGGKGRGRGKGREGEVSEGGRGAAEVAEGGDLLERQEEARRVGPSF